MLTDEDYFYDEMMAEGQDATDAEQEEAAGGLLLRHEEA